MPNAYGDRKDSTVAEIHWPSDSDAPSRLRNVEALSKVWGNLPGTITLVPSTFLGKDGRDPVTGWGELRALIYIMSVLYTYYHPNRIAVLPSQLAAGHRQDLLGDNLIVIGGPAANNLAHLLLEEKNEWRLDVPFSFDDNYVLTDSQKHSLRTQYKTSGDPFSMITDYGCIVHRELELWGRKRRLWMFMGCHTYGTYAASVACFSEDFCTALMESSQTDHYDVLTKIENLQAIMTGEGHVKVYTEKVGDLAAVGPILNPASLDAVIRTLTEGVKMRAVFKKKIAYALLALAMVTLVLPQLIKLYILLLG